MIHDLVAVCTMACLMIGGLGWIDRTPLTLASDPLGMGEGAACLAAPEPPHALSAPALSAAAVAAAGRRPRAPCAA